MFLMNLSFDFAKQLLSKLKRFKCWVLKKVFFWTNEIVMKEKPNSKQATLGNKIVLI